MAYGAFDFKKEGPYMITWVAVGVAALYVLVSGCNSKSDDDGDTGGADGTGGADDSGGTVSDSDAIGGDEDSLLSDEDAADPRLRDGFRMLSEGMEGYDGCNVADLDCRGGSLVIQCGPRLNSLYSAKLPADPTSFEGVVHASSMGVIPTDLVTEEGVVKFAAEQAVGVGDNFGVPFNSFGDDAVSLSGVAYASGEGMVTGFLLDPIGGVVPGGIRSLAVADDASGSPRLFLLGSDSASEDGQGVVVSCPLEYDGSLKPNDPSFECEVIKLPCRNPTAMEMVGKSLAMILSADADDPSVLFLDLGADDPASSAASVPLSEAVVPLNEIAMDDGLAVLPAVGGAILVFDVEGRQERGSLSGSEAVRSVAVEVKKAYVALKDDIR
ncbi:MAG TPA: hypothetical protein PLY45_02820, partial [bacterium]|nr:hypothetical protein [bacterium]